MSTRTNYVRNPVLNTDLTGYNGVAGRSRVASVAWTDEAVIRAPTTTASADQGVWVHDLPLTLAVGQPWTFSVDVAGSGTVYLQIQERATGSWRSGGNGSPVTLAAGGARYSLTRIITSADANQLRLVVQTNVAQAITFEATRWMLEQADTAGDYFDGDSPNAEWTGTPHASTSVLTISDTRVFPVLQIGSSHVGPMRVGKD